MNVEETLPLTAVPVPVGVADVDPKRTRNSYVPYPPRPVLANKLAAVRISPPVDAPAEGWLSVRHRQGTPRLGSTGNLMLAAAMETFDPAPRSCLLCRFAEPNSW